MKKILIVGGGAAGFFAALTCAERHPDYEVCLIEKTQKLLTKVKMSGGGRCNVTHACFDAAALTKFYPRGEKELLGPFTRFGPAQMVHWLTQHGVRLKTERDGRMFPISDLSTTIIDCFLREAHRKKITILRGCGLDDLSFENGKWQICTSAGTVLYADAVILAAGSAPRVWAALRRLGHTIIEPVPSLFTFTIRDERLRSLRGISVPDVSVSVVGQTKLQTSGALLITHWGLSGPAVLKLSAWGARALAAIHYNFEIALNWTGGKTKQEVVEEIKKYRAACPKHKVENYPLFCLPLRLWQMLLPRVSGNYADLAQAQIERLAEMLTHTVYKVEGKSTFKEEFVTAGGVALKEINFKTMESKLFAGLYLAGEVIDVDAITGGFNFQAAWTTGYICGISV